jgi:hypothetical protein
VRILLDESVPRQLAAHLGEHEVTTVTGQGWSGLQNGELLRRAAGTFDVFVTGDRGIEHQQNMTALGLGLVVIVARDNRVETVIAPAPRIREALEAVKPGTTVRVVSA